jgi:hypothetical protein
MMLKKQAPIWIRRLDVVKAELKNMRFPKSAYEGSRQCAELSETANRWVLESLRESNPGAGEEAIEQARRLLAARFSATEFRYMKRWKKERDRFFRG